jgi:hypothetical protein
MRARKFLVGLISIVLLATPLVVLWQRQAVFDWWRLRGYEPSVAVSQLATDTTMVSSMRRLYYVYHPSIDEKTAFNQACRENEQTIVLGCYINGRSIHILSVTDSRLDGVEQVTAAHEALHAVYARLSGAERKKVDTMTAAAFAAITDQRLKDVIELYRKQDPSVVPNELHSILGTEVRSLPADLEAYYTRYFSDRSKVVDYSEQYEQAFTDRKNQILSYDAQLSSLKEQIQALQTSLNNQSKTLTNERNQLTNLKSGGQTNAYNAAVPAYNAKVNAYNSDIDTLTGLINQYNDIVPKRNAIASEEQDLVQAIDSRESVPARQ